MKRFSRSRRAAGITYVVVHVLVRLLSVLLVLLVAAFVFLRLYGMPDPLLQLLVRRANAAGIPIQVESLSLTMRGWLAGGVSYYSRHPDDLAPMFEAEEVLFSRRRAAQSENVRGWKVDVSASQVRITPSVEWGVSIPEASPVRLVDEISLTAAMFPDRVVFSNAALQWLGIEFHVDGVLLKKPRELPGPRGSRPDQPAEKVQETVLPVYVDAAAFEALETRFNQLSAAGPIRADIRFTLDMGNYAASAADVSLQAEDVELRGVDFDDVLVEFSYAYPRVDVSRLRIGRRGQALEMQAEYDLASRLAAGRIDSSITARKLLQLAPQEALGLLAKAGVQFDELPEFSLQAGPAPVEALLQQFSGSFSLRDVTYAGLVIEAAHGTVQRSGGFLDIKDVEARVQGQEYRAAAVGSGMAGGTVQGRVFWDADRALFGVEAEGSADPNLLMEPLARVSIATNVIGRFSFPEEPPRISLQLGACYTNWHTFHMDISGAGHDVVFHEGRLSSANVSASYTNAVLELDPIAVMDGADFLKGNASINFRGNAAVFDVFGSLHPALIEDAVWPFFNVFGNFINTAGKTDIKARGRLDWASMQTTDFEAEVEAERLEVPVAVMDQFKGRVIGRGARISVTNAVCGLYGGKGSGSFGITLDPAVKNLPYAMNVRISGADLKRFQAGMKRPPHARTKGTLSGKLQVRSDLSDHFLVHADGRGSISVEDGELVDLPVFSGFSKLMRKIMPGFNFFSITSLGCDFRIKKGAVSTKNAAFTGDLFHADAAGSYSYTEGYDAEVRVNVFGDKGLSKVMRVITSPISKLFELHLSGMLDAPEWRLKNFTPTPGAEVDSD